MKVGQLFRVIELGGTYGSGSNTFEITNQYSLSSSLGTPNISNGEIEIIRGVTLTMDISFLLVALSLSIAIPLSYYIFIEKHILDKLQKKFKRRRKTPSTYYKKYGQFDEGVEAFAMEVEDHEQHSRSSLFWKMACFCGWRNVKNFILTTPPGADNSLAAINEFESFALFQSTPFQLFDRLCCLCSNPTTSTQEFNSISESNVRIRSVTSKTVKEYNISSWVSSFFLLFVRLGNLALAIVTAVYIGKDEFNSNRSFSEKWFDYSKFLTNNTFNLFVVYTTLVAFAHLLYLFIVAIYALKRRKPSSGNTDNVTFPFSDLMPRWLEKSMHWCGNILWIISELNLVSSGVVAFG